MRKTKEKLKKYFHKISKIESSPHLIAMGFAIGTFIGIFPTPGISILLGLLIIVLFKKVSKIALFGGLILFNPLVNIPFGIALFALGDFIFRGVPVKEFDIQFFNYVYHFTRRSLVGIVIIASVMAIINYFLMKYIIIRIRYKKKIH